MCVYISRVENSVRENGGSSDRVEEDVDMWWSDRVESRDADAVEWQYERLAEGKRTSERRYMWQKERHMKSERWEILER